MMSHLHPATIWFILEYFACFYRWLCHVACTKFPSVGCYQPEINWISHSAPSQNSRFSDDWGSTRQRKVVSSKDMVNSSLLGGHDSPMGQWVVDISSFDNTSGFAVFSCNGFCIHNYSTALQAALWNCLVVQCIRGFWSTPKLWVLLNWPF